MIQPCTPAASDGGSYNAEFEETCGTPKRALTWTCPSLHLLPMSFLGKYSDPIYCIMRLVVGLMLACHGLQLVCGMFGGMPGSGKMITQVGGWIQLVGGSLIALGLLTRPAAFLCSGMMAVAYFMFHVASAATPMAKLLPIASAGPQFSNKGELAVLYCFVFLYIAARGGGLWSVDAMMGRSPVVTDDRVH